MDTSRTMATAVTIVALICTARVATAGDQYVFPSINGAQLAAMPTPSFVVPPPGAVQRTASAKLEYGHSTHEPPLPTPAYASGPHAPSAASRLMSHALMVAPYANYAADYSRLFAPNYALTSWTDRVFGIVSARYGAVDGWTAAAYELPRLAGPRRSGESVPDLSPMPKFRAHPELQESPTFDRQAH